jgi:hypothetical protein
MKIKVDKDRLNRIGISIYRKKSELNINNESELMSRVECLFSLFMTIYIYKKEYKRGNASGNDETTKLINIFDLEIIKELMDTHIKIVCDLNKELNYDGIWKGYNLRIKKEKIIDYYE